MDSITASTVELEEAMLYNEKLDKIKEYRAEFMYNKVDYDNDRTKVRNKFL
jgi:hypothetical protein